MNVLMVSTSYPLHAEDWRGRFIYDMAAALGKQPSQQLSLWAPAGPLPPGVTSALLPGDAESTKALEITEELNDGEKAPTVIVYRRDGGLTEADKQAIEAARRTPNTRRPYLYVIILASPGTTQAGAESRGPALEPLLSRAVDGYP